MSTTRRPITLLICALGGEGGGVLTDWLVQAARLARLPMQATSVPGVAQRTGATTYYLECQVDVSEQDHSASLVFGLNPLPGRIDLLVSSELLETARQVQLGMPSAEHTWVLTSTQRALTVAERMRPGDGRMDEQALLQLVQTHCRRLDAVDFTALAKQAHTMVSAVLLGAIAATGVLPLGRPHYEAAIRGERDPQSPGVLANLDGFALGWMSLQGAATDQDTEAATPQAEHGADKVLAFHHLMESTAQRMRAYQNAAYERLFRERMQRIISAEHRSAEAAAMGYPIAPALMPWLALWMMHEDVAEVARLKSRRERWQRVVHETGFQPGQLLKVEEFLKPGVPELSALLPSPLARLALAWDRRRQLRGLPAWSKAIRLQTHTPTGMLTLRLLASLRWLRPLGHEHRQVQRDIETWLSAVLQAMAVSTELALEMARLGRLIKGFGTTHARSMSTFEHLLKQVALNESLSLRERTLALRAALKASSAEAGVRALNAALQAHQAPTLAPVAQPIRWMPRSKTPGTA